MPEQVGHDTQSITDGTALAESLLERCQILLKELEELRVFVEEQKVEHNHAVDVRKFQTSVNTEYKSLQRVGFSLQVS